MKRIIWAVLILVAVGAVVTNAGEPSWTSSTVLYRVTDGIGRQYACISSSHVNKYGFGGAGDTLSTDSTVARGCIMNIHRIKEGTDAALGELLPAFLSSQTQLDSSYLYSKWSNICWALNNFYAPTGGLNGYIATKSDSGRLSPRFARVARANGIYLAPKAVFPESLNFGSAVLESGGAYTYSDTNAIDSTLYGPTGITSTGTGTAHAKPWFKLASVSGTGSCTLQVWGSNQNLVHGRRWKTFVDQTSTAGPYLIGSDVTGDSLYNIDSSKVKTYTGTLAATVLIFNRTERVDSL